MIPDEIEHFIQAVRSGTEPSRPAAARSAPRRRQPSASSRALGELLMPALADPAAVPKLAELQRRIVAEHAATRRAAQEEAAAASMAAQEQVLASAAQRVDAAQIIADLPPVDGTPLYFLLRQPFLIWPTDIALDDAQIVDLQSYARFRVYTDIGQDSSGSVRFYYFWTNPYPDSVFVNLAVFGIWNGYCEVYLNGGLFSEDTAGTTVGAALEVLPVWQANAVFTQEDTRSVFAASRQNGGFYSGFWEEAAATHSGTALTMTDLLIPGTRTVIFTMTASQSAYVYDDGGSSVDFSTQGYLFGSPAALVTVTGRVVAP